ncbi:hypothetical protein KRP22_006283 [Phytophthora ramorum]|nr:hypothetical protein KRP22_2585 [Phytophthora ramorum]
MENAQMEGEADDVALTPPYSGREPVGKSALPVAQRVRTVRLTTRVHPELLVPYLYGERGGRSINGIVRSTGCTIDYCALSPDEAERSPETLKYVMNFLVSAASSERLEDATRQLRTLVERLQVHLQKKPRIARTEVDDVRFYEPGRRGRTSPSAKREAAPEDRRTDEDAWAQRMYFGGQRGRRYVDVDADEKIEFGRSGRPAEAVAADAAYRQRSDPPVHFVARRRVRRYPEHPRWTPRNYPAHPRGEVGYTMYAADAGNEQTQRISRPRARHIYQGPSSHFTQTEFSPYEYDDGDENDAEFDGYDGAVDLTSENAGANNQAEFVDVSEQHQPVHHPRRSLKRPFGKMRSDGPPPPPIYRQRMPYIYDYTYEDEDDEWMTEDEEMAVAYGYQPQYRHMEVPVVHRRRRLNSVSSQQWSSPVGRMYKRRRIPREELELEVSEEPFFESRGREHITPPPGADVRTALLDQLDEAAERATADTFPGREDDDTETERVLMEDNSTVANISESHSDNIAHHDKHGESSPVNESIPASNTDEVLTEPNVNLAANTSTIAPTTEQEIANPNDDLLGSADDKPHPDAEIKQGASIERIAQREVVPLTPGLTMQEKTGCTSPQRPTASTSSPPRKSPRCPLGEEESRIASPPHSVASDESRDIVRGGDSVMDCSALRGATTSVTEENNAKPTQPPVLLTSVEAGAQRSTVANDLHPVALITQAGSPVENIVTDTVRINNRVIASLERMNKEETAFEVAKTSLTAQEDKFRRLGISSKHHHRLEVLCGIMYELQCQIGSLSCGLSQERKQQLLDKLDSYLEMMLAESEQTLEEKVDAMQDGLKRLLTVDRLDIEEPVPKRGAMLATSTIAAATKPFTPQTPAGENPDKVDEATHMNCEDDDWFEETAPIDPASESEEQDNFVAHISPKKSNLKFEGDFLAVKLEQGASLSWPRELPPFVWSLLARVISSDPQSYVMRVTHKRLMDEIAKGDPYYYLHPTEMSDDTAVPLRSQLCEFGCRGASALKWERKLVSQISSRMKSFDNVAYSLARSSGGKEVLNRKKMNSIIRKLHLVAMQLHSLVSHLYCVKGQSTCKEVDSLPIALNNSHFERKMGVYKSRLKLVVPHKYQQQQQQSPQQQLASTSEPAEELLRDTYEFFPELLLCVDIWGYNYREGRAKRHNSKSVLGEKYSGSGAASEGALYPLGFFRDVENLAFDFEHDSNGLLRCICDELLNIVCLWNDFKWTDNLEAVALERVVSFETDVTASIIKILDLYAHHLQALWAVRLLDEPEQLRSVHFTQFNAYYSDRSQGSLNPTAVSQSRLSKTNGPNANVNTVDQLVANEIVEQRLAEEYWNRKVTALSTHNPDDDAMEGDGANPKPSQLLSTEAICSWDHETLVSCLLRWSDVYAMRSEVNALSAVTNHMLKHEVQQYRHANRGGNIESGGTGVGSVMVDTASRQLLAAVSRAQMLSRDALVGAEKLALHSASNQLPDERKHPCEETELAGEASGVNQPEGASNSDFSQEVSLDQANTSTSSGAEVSHEQADEVAASEPELASQTVGQPDVLSSACSNVAALQETNFETGTASDQPELRDLIQLLAVTKQDMQELCGHRPRSARMREKVQTQSLQLARQTVEIFRNIKNMYGSQQRR